MARYGVYFILCLSCLAVSPGWQSETREITSGATIKLECKEDFPIHWCYPRVYTDDCTIKESTDNVEEFYKETEKYKGRLIIKSATYADTGYYFCVSNGTDECNINMEVTDRTYVYVKDNEILLVTGYGFCNIEGELNGNAVLPCRPTSPDLKITLHKDGSIEGVNQRTTYDPTIGFTLNKIEITDSGRYTCQVDDSEPEFSATIDLRVSKRKTYVMKPNINGQQHHIIVRKWKDLVLECQGLADKETTLTVMWLLPNSLQSTTSEKPCNVRNYNCILTTLWIMNVTENDGGNYTCVVMDKYNNTNNDTRTVTIIGDGELGISLESDSSDPIVIQAGQTKEMKIVVNVLAPENVTFNWYGPQGNQLYPDGIKYGIERRYNQTILRVFNVTLHDVGAYRLDANNSVGKESLTRRVIVQDRPNVSLSPKLSLFPLHSQATFTCVVWSSSPAEVNWYFKMCDLRKPGDCDGEENNERHIGPACSGEYVNSTLERCVIPNFSLTVQQGILRCVAYNSFGNGSDEIKLYVTDHPQVNQTPHLWGEPKNVVLEMEDTFSVVEGDNFTLNCASSVYNNTRNPLWYIQNSTVHNTTELTVKHNKTEFVYISSLEFFNVTKKQHAADYVCYENNNTAIPLGKQIKVSDADNAKIIETNLKDMEVPIGESLNLTCRSAGMPEPETLWYKDGELVVNNTRVELTERNQSLKIARVKPDNVGKYRCVVKNRLYKDAVHGYVTIAGKQDFTPFMIGIIVVCVLGLVMLTVVLVVKIQKQKKLREELNRMGIANFEIGAPESINPELPVDEQANLLPYDRTWEFPKEKLVLGKQLGSGAFGVVMKAEAYGIVDCEEKTSVAVKMVKSGVDRSFIKALTSELKIMIHLGKHLNIVNLLGASTKGLARMELMVIVEYCRYGNLHDYLLRHRDDFIDQLDRTTGKLNLALGTEKISRTQTSTKKTNLKHRFLSSASSVAGVSYYGDSSSDLCAPSSSNTTEVSILASDMTVMSSPTGEPDECLLSSGSSEQPNWRVKYGSDYTGTAMPVCSQDLLCWAFQVARGMEYLVSRKVLHGDLAARNILLADDHVVKICDFGLAKSMYKSDNYWKKSASPLPVKWMALESIRDGVFSTQSDVWSFGIVLWELFSLAQNPYAGLEAGERLFLKLANGYRMEQPPYATNDIYRTMLQCWKANPLERPSFTELAQQLGVMLDDNIRRHYEELNNPYVNMNQQNQRTDYLNMMSAHNYSNIIAPHEAEYEHDSSRISCPEQNTRHSNIRSSAGVMSPHSADISELEFSDEITKPCYINMMGKEVIFSPGHEDENPFKYFPNLQEEQEEQVQLLTEMNRPNSENHREGTTFEQA